MGKYKLGIIGCGNMSTAIWQGILDSGLAASKEIIVSDKDTEKLKTAAEKGITVTDDNLAAINAEYVLFAVKPQIFPAVAEEIKGKTADSVLISIMAGITIEKIKMLTGSNKIARIMPNTPCMIKKGISAISFDGVSELGRAFVLALFSGIGEVIELPESKFDAVTSVSGSGPAYIYMFLDGMIKGGIEGGLSYEQAKALAVKTMQGASELFNRQDKPLEELISAVCSKGGTTIEAVNVFRERKLTEIISDGIRACRKRSEELSKL